MNRRLQEDLNQLGNVLNATKQLGEEYLLELNERKTSVNTEAIAWPQMPEQGFGAVATLEAFKNIFYPYIVATSGPRYWGFVTGGTTPASIAGDWLATIFDQNTQSTSGVGDASALLELQTIQYLLDLFGLPVDFTGVFVTGATMANFTGLAVARQWYGKVQGLDIARDGLRTDIPVYAAMPHSSSLKALAMLGIGSANLHAIPCLPKREAIDIEALKIQLPKDKKTPFILIASAGTVNSVDFDDFEALAGIKAEYNCWLHVDAAFGGFAVLSEEHAHMVKGWEQADSITIDFHKWMNVPYENAMILIRQSHARHQVESFQNSSAPYLGNPLEQFSFLNNAPENSRRFRALPVWFTLMAYGKEGYRDLVEQSILMARLFAARLLDTGYFRLLSPVRLNTVCFQPLTAQYPTLTITALLRELNREGELFMTPSVYLGEHCIRAALVNYRTDEAAIDRAIIAIQKAVRQLLNSNPV